MSTLTIRAKKMRGWAAGTELSYFASIISSIIVALVAQPYWCNIEPVFSQYGT